MLFRHVVILHLLLISKRLHQCVEILITGVLAYKNTMVNLCLCICTDKLTWDMSYDNAYKLEYIMSPKNVLLATMHYLDIATGDLSSNEAQAS